MISRPLWLDDPVLQQFFTAIEQAGGEARVVGGAVRDCLLGRSSDDIDIACSLLPNAAMATAEQHGWKAVPTGVMHGTATVVLPNRTIEVTTLRRDVATDGRHATVAFTDSFEEDAARRDFTFNAMSIDRHGQLYDYFDGQGDLAAQRVRFIGDAAQRIREDGLRILRYFRFLATHGQPPADHDALNACTHHKPMLEKLSGERIQQEMKKLLGAPDPRYALSQMSLMAFGESLCKTPWQLGLLHALLQHESQHKLAPSPWLRLLALIAPHQRMAAAAHVCARWKLSRADTHLLEFLTAPPALNDDHGVKEALRHFKREWVMDALLLQSLDAPQQVPYAKLIPIARSFDPPVFPVTARDLMTRGMQEGPELGDRLRALEQRWIDSRYRLKKEELLA